MKRIFKSILIIAAIATFIMPYKASAADDKLVQFGVKAGLNFTNMTDMGDFKDEFMKSYTGFNAGILLKFNLPLGFEIQPEVLYYQSGFNSVSEILHTKAKFTEGSIRVPINIQWGISIWELKPYLMVSPFLGCSLFQLTKGVLDGAFSSIQLETAAEKIERFQYGIGIGAGIDIWKFQVAFKWNWNFNNLQKEGTALHDEKFNGGELSLAFIF